MSTTAILPGKFDGGDSVAWLREFDACCAANGWKSTESADQKLLKLPAFLRGQAASHFYTIPTAKRATYETAVTELKKAMCPEACRENYFAEFEQRLLRPGEDAAVYKWELGEILRKADPSLHEAARQALLTRQFMRGLPQAIRLKLLEHNPTPTLEEMTQFVQRYRALQRDAGTAAIASSSAVADDQLATLVSMVKDLASHQKSMQDQLARNVNRPEERTTRPQNNRKCYRCVQLGHFARNCRRGPHQRQCQECHGFGHAAKDCANLNFKGAAWTAPM